LSDLQKAATEEPKATRRGDQDQMCRQTPDQPTSAAATLMDQEAGDTAKPYTNMSNTFVYV